MDTQGRAQQQLQLLVHTRQDMNTAMAVDADGQNPDHEDTDEGIEPTWATNTTNY